MKIDNSSIERVEEFKHLGTTLTNKNSLQEEIKSRLKDLYSLPNIVRVVKIDKNEMGGACGAYGGGESCAQGSGGETWGKETIGETQT